LGNAAAAAAAGILFTATICDLTTIAVAGIDKSGRCPGLPSLLPQLDGDTVVVFVGIGKKARNDDEMKKTS